MRKVDTKLPGAYILEMESNTDDRGSYTRLFSHREFEEHGLPVDVTQQNRVHSTTMHTLRGLHYQLPPAQEAKTVSCTRGAILDVFVDLRRDSPTHMGRDSVELSAR